MKKRLFLLATTLATTLSLAGVARAQEPLPVPPASEIQACQAEQSVIEGVEEGATVSFWTLSLAPTFDLYLQDVFTRFEETYGVTVDWLDVPFGEAQTRLRTAFAAGDAPDVVNLSGAWVPEFAEAGQIVNMSEVLPEAVAADYIPGALNAFAVEGAAYQVPWYLSIEFMLYNRAILEEAGLTEEDLPTNYEELAEVGRTIQEQTGRFGFVMNLLESDVFLKYLAQYGIPILDENGQAAFNTPEAAERLQYFVDLVNDGVIPQDIVNIEHRQMLDRFSSGEIAIVFTGPQLARLIKENNPETYENLGIAPMVVGPEGGADLGVMSLVVNAQSDAPNAALALATFVTNPCNMIQFSQMVPIYPSTLSALEDPFFQTNGELVEESARVPAAESLPTAEVLLPTLPSSERFLEEVQNAVTSALLGELTAQEALDQAVDVINNEVLTQ
jgi:putative chitobiose transport system substrate-binding protein